VVTIKSIFKSHKLEQSTFKVVAFGLLLENFFFRLFNNLNYDLNCPPIKKH